MRSSFKRPLINDELPALAKYCVLFKYDPSTVQYDVNQGKSRAYELVAGVVTMDEISAHLDGINNRGHLTPPPLIYCLYVYSLLALSFLLVVYVFSVLWVLSMLDLVLLGVILWVLRKLFVLL